MKEKNYLGTFALGMENVRLYVDDSPMFAAAFVCRPNDKGSPKMFVSLTGRPWSDVLASVMHECLESRLHARGAAYFQTQTPRETTDAYVFIMTHYVMDQALDWTARFVSDCAETLRTEWERRNKPAKGKRK